MSWMSSSSDSWLYGSGLSTAGSDFTTSRGRRHRGRLKKGKQRKGQGGKRSRRYELMVEMQQAVAAAQEHGTIGVGGMTIEQFCEQWRRDHVPSEDAPPRRQRW